MQRKAIRDTGVMLSHREDLNMQLPHHDLTLMKAKRLGNGIVAPLTDKLQQQMRVPETARVGRSVPPAKTAKEWPYLSVMG